MIFFGNIFLISHSGLCIGWVVDKASAKRALATNTLTKTWIGKLFIHPLKVQVRNIV